MEVTEQIKSTIANMKNGHYPSDNTVLLPLLASEDYSKCQYLIMQTMSFETVPKMIWSKQCPYQFYEEEWQTDPCCNWELHDTMCCAETEREVPILEAR